MSAATIGYEEAKRLARDQDPAVRGRLAERSDVRPEILYYLAEDPSGEVRRRVARNDKTPAQAAVVLARDGDEEVRRDLARRVGRLLPALSGTERRRAQRYVVETLELLARDQASRVRQILAEALKDVANAPGEVIHRLARDADGLVAGPILEFSPLLSEQDLIAIIGEGCVTGKLNAISRRRNLGWLVADAIVASDDERAITTLLENESAQIREETLDSLVDRAAAVEAWHGPLVARPRISSRAARKLASYVASNLIEQLLSRRDLDEATGRLIAQEVARRLHSQDLDEEADDDAHRDEDPAALARRLQDEEQLDEARIEQAVGRGDRGFVRAALALLAALPEATVDRILGSRSAKGVTALSWKAGLRMRTATQLQLRLCGIPPREALHARDGIDYPLTSEEMTWQLEFFAGFSA